MNFVQLRTVAAGTHCRGVQGRPPARGPTQPSTLRWLSSRSSQEHAIHIHLALLRALLTSFLFLKFCTGDRRSLLARRRCASSLLGLFFVPQQLTHAAAAGPLLCPSAAYTRGYCRGKIQDGAPVPRAGFTRPGAPSEINRAVRFWTRLFSPPGHEQACKREAAAPGESATGAAAAAPPALRHTRRGLTSPSPALPAYRGAPATQVGCPGLPGQAAVPAAATRPRGGAFQDVSR
ncbi:hypothetical protein NDU88_006867 [Pleurodeles waltl]|uniref:Uncharacterized protein n=1 Tax=Pleurodeles waltl TaxID=8319 RepID=A0AAV7ML89_PLEWA|nr:hypothetical protein NDU88_006867 [Pleurodeles waltl]